MPVLRLSWFRSRKIDISNFHRNNPVALITGASSGIGKEIAREFVNHGFACLIHGGSDQDKLDQTVEELAGVGGEVNGILADFDREDGWQALAQQAWLWKGHIDVLVNNAGVDLLTKSTELPLPKKLELLANVDIRSTMMLSYQLGQQMQEDSRTNRFENGALSICNIGWDQAEQGMAGDSGVLFSASKGAIMSMTRSLAQSLAPEVRVNCVAPGWIKTDWGQAASEHWQEQAKSNSLMNRWGTPSDVAAAVYFLSTGTASFVSGQILNVNGGFRY